MSSERVIPLFSGVENPAAAVALSEPFLRPEAFRIQFSDDRVESGTINPDELVAIGASYIDDDGQVAFEYAMHPLTEAPYAAAQAFVDGYDKRITREHRETDRASRTLDEITGDGVAGIGFWERIAVEYAEKAGLRTMGAFAVFSFQEIGYTGSVIVAHTIVQGAPLEGRQNQMDLQQHVPDVIEAYGALIGLAAGATSEELDKTQRDIAQNRDQDDFGVSVALLQMPRVQALRKTIDAHPEVDGFMALSRKERRALLKTEQKNLRRQTP